MKSTLTVGIDIGGTNTIFGFVDESGSVIHKDSIPTNTNISPEEFVEILAIRIQENLNKELKKWTLGGIGIGAPNGNFHTGSIEFAPNLNWEGIVPLCDYFKKYFQAPVILTNDANAAAIGEKRYGGAREMNDFILITLGTGLGSGIVINGQLVYGHDGFAGELGHVIVQKNGRICGCGRRGCLETYCSAPGIVRTALELLSEKNSDSRIKQYSINQLNSKVLAELAAAGDHIAREAYIQTGKTLGLALANSVAFSSPEAIFLFGGPVNAGDLLFQPLREAFEANLLSIYKNKIQVLPSQLPQGDAAILGAAALIPFE